MKKRRPTTKRKFKRYLPDGVIANHPHKYSRRHMNRDVWGGRAILYTTAIDSTSSRTCLDLAYTIKCYFTGRYENLTINYANLCYTYFMFFRAVNFSGDAPHFYESAIRLSYIKDSAIRYGVFDYCVIADCTFDIVEFHKCTFDNVVFQNCTFIASDFRRCSFVRCKFVDCTFERTSFFLTEYVEQSFLPSSEEAWVNADDVIFSRIATTSDQSPRESEYYQLKDMSWFYPVERTMQFVRLVCFVFSDDDLVLLGAAYSADKSRYTLWAVRTRHGIEIWHIPFTELGRLRVSSSWVMSDARPWNTAKYAIPEDLIDDPDFY